MASVFGSGQLDCCLEKSCGYSDVFQDVVPARSGIREKPKSNSRATDEILGLGKGQTLLADELWLPQSETQFNVIECLGLPKYDPN